MCFRYAVVVAPVVVLKVSINPLVASLDSHTTDLTNLATLPNNAILVTLDVSSLYTNIPHNEWIDAWYS